METIPDGPDVDDQPYRKVIQNCWNDCDLDNLYITGFRQLGEQKSAGTHDRGHLGATSRCGRLNRAGKLRLIPDPFHQRDSKGTGGHHIGNTATRNHTE